MATVTWNISVVLRDENMKKILIGNFWNTHEANTYLWHLTAALSKHINAIEYKWEKIDNGSGVHVPLGQFTKQVLEL